jgi:hypothetical protein
MKKRDIKAMAKIHDLGLEQKEVLEALKLYLKAN